MVFDPNGISINENPSRLPAVLPLSRGYLVSINKFRLEPVVKLKRLESLCLLAEPDRAYGRAGPKSARDTH